MPERVARGAGQGSQTGLPERAMDVTALLP